MDLPWAVFGENLTTEGLREDVRIGDRFRIGSAEFVVTQPRLPCYKLGIRFGRMDMLKRMLRSGRTGFYFAVTTEGEVGAGDAIEPIERAEEDLTVADVVRLYTVDAQEPGTPPPRDPDRRSSPRAGRTTSASGSGTPTLEAVRGLTAFPCRS